MPYCILLCQDQLISVRGLLFSEGKLWKNGFKEARACEGLRQMEGGETEVEFKSMEGWKYWIEEGNGECYKNTKGRLKSHMESYFCRHILKYRHI